MKSSLQMENRRQVSEMVAETRGEGLSVNCARRRVKGTKHTPRRLGDSPRTSQPSLKPLRKHHSCVVCVGRGPNAMGLLEKLCVCSSIWHSDPLRCPLEMQQIIEGILPADIQPQD